VRRLDNIDDAFPVRIGAPVRDLDVLKYVDRKTATRHARFTLLAMAAATEAAADAGVADARYEPERQAVVIGVGLGGLEMLHQAALDLQSRGPRRVRPFGLPALIPNMAAGMTAAMLNARGPSFCTSSACASSAHAIAQAARLLQCREADVVFCGGSEGCLDPLALACFSRMGVLSQRNDAPERACRPFDAQRDGFVLGEGAAVLVLERMARARARGARIYAELAGCGSSSDAFHPTTPESSGAGAAHAMTRAPADARIDPSDVVYVNAHGTATPHSDIVETRALKLAFGKHAKRLWISSTKSMTGHMLGASGAFEAAVCALAIHSGAVPPTINLDEPGEECDLDYVAHEARRGDIRVAMTNSFGFGGQNVSIVLRQVP
jgi:3-oxoacyl-[acyl-carrier-protein] synthase II